MTQNFKFIIKTIIFHCVNKTFGNFSREMDEWNMEIKSSHAITWEGIPYSFLTKARTKGS